jgi:hypothetical protein
MGFARRTVSLALLLTLGACTTNAAAPRVNPSVSPSPSPDVARVDHFVVALADQDRAAVRLLTASEIAKNRTEFAASLRLIIGDVIAIIDEIKQSPPSGIPSQTVDDLVTAYVSYVRAMKALDQCVSSSTGPCSVLVREATARAARALATLKRLASFASATVRKKEGY